MKASCAAALILLCVPAVMSTNHTLCYNYFFTKDKCVFASASTKTRCIAPPKTRKDPVPLFRLQSVMAKRSGVAALERRYATDKHVFFLASGSGNCAPYDTEKDDVVCLWNGPEQNNPTVQTAGWLNSQKTSNCGKRVYIQRFHSNETVYAKVGDGCSFGAVEPKDGCFRIGISRSIFEKLVPTQAERNAGAILSGLNWDFDNLHGQSPQQGPV